MTLWTPSGEEVTFIDVRSNYLSNVISTAIARTMDRKGCDTYLAYVIDTKKAEPSLSDISTVCDYLDVFLEEFPRFLHRERLSSQSTLFRVPLRHPLHRIEWLRYG